MRGFPLLAVSVLVAIAIGAEIEGALPPPAPLGAEHVAAGAPASPSVFYGVWSPVPSNTYVIEQFAASTGAPLRTITTLPQGSSDLYRGPNDSLWWSVGSGPRCTSNVAGCGPVPRSCHGAAEELGANGVTRVVMNFPSSLEAGPPVPSPRGSDVAFLEGGCATGYLNQHIVIRNLRTNTQWSIGADAKVCHEYSVPAWDRSGAHLVFAYEPSLVTSTTPLQHGFGQGVCLSPAPGRLVIVTADRSSATSSWRSANPDAGCSYTTAVFDAWGIAAVETCGENGLGAAYLVQLTRNLTGERRFALPPQADGITLSSSPSGTAVLIDEYESTSENSGVPADTVVPPGDQAGPYIWMDTFNGAAIRVVRCWGNISVNLAGLTW